MFTEGILKLLFHEATVFVITQALIVVVCYLAINGEPIPQEVGGPLALCLGYLFRGQIDKIGLTNTPSV